MVLQKGAAYILYIY